MNNLDIYEKVRKVPDEAKKTIQAGRTKGFTDINPMWRIKTLTDLFGLCGIGWYYDVAREWTETVGDEICAFVDINLYIKLDNEWSKPIRGTGGSKLATKEKSGVYVSDECYKMATTDAISVACKQLGFGADVYWSADRTKYDHKYESQNKDVLDAKFVNNLVVELSRTGVGINQMLSNYGLKDIHDMSIDQYKEAMSILQSKPNKK